MKKLLPLLLLCITNFIHAQLTYVPDNNFEAYLEANGMGNGIPNDDYVTTSNIENTTILDISGNNIADLTGIENFVALTQLDCFENLLIDLDLSVLPSLERVDASENLILNVNLSNNPNLAIVSINENFLTTIDVSLNPNLKDLFVDSNSITSIDISQNLLLEKISCNNNRLTSLNAKNGTNNNITTFATVGNPNLTCIQVDNATYSTTNWTNIDIISNFNEDCNSVLNTNSFELNGISIYPNPTQSVLNIKGNIDTIDIYAPSGQHLKHFKDDTVKIDISDLQPAIYFVTLSKNTFTRTFKIIKK